MRWWRVSEIILCNTHFVYNFRWGIFDGFYRWCESDDSTTFDWNQTRKFDRFARCVDSSYYCYCSRQIDIKSKKTDRMSKSPTKETMFLSNIATAKTTEISLFSSYITTKIFEIQLFITETGAWRLRETRFIFILFRFFTWYNTPQSQQRFIGVASYHENKKKSVFLMTNW